MTILLKLHNLTIAAKIGNSSQERITPQDIIINLELKFPQLPGACNSDKIEDTVCYNKLTNLIYEHCKNKEFHLIEYLGYQLFSLIRKEVREDIGLKLILSKLKPPMIALADSVSFQCSDY